MDHRVSTMAQNPDRVQAPARLTDRLRLGGEGGEKKEK